MVIICSVSVFYSMFRTAVSIFRTAERTFRSGERTFRSAEYKSDACYNIIMIAIVNIL